MSRQQQQNTSDSSYLQRNRSASQRIPSEKKTARSSSSKLRLSGTPELGKADEPLFGDGVMTNVSEHIVSTIESKREFLGMSKAELSRRTNIGAVTLGTMLRGLRAIYADEAIVLCVALGINPVELVPADLRKIYNELWG